MRLLILLACASALTAADKLPAPYATPSVKNGPKVTPKPDEVRLRVPEGFQVEQWASGFVKPRILLAGQSGEVLLADSAPAPNGVVYVYPNADAKQGRKLIEGIDRPYGLAWWKNYLYVGTPESIDRYPYDAKSLSVGPVEHIVKLEGTGKKGHWARALTFDGKGEKLYVGIGSGSDHDPDSDPRRAAIHRYNPDGTGDEIVASGIRNPTAIRFFPGSKTLWTTVQERDDLGDELVPDYFTHIQEGAFYGWPFAYAGTHEEPRLKGQHPELVAKSVAGDVMLGAHVAVMDFTFYMGKQFPAKYRNGAFIAFHGSNNRSSRVGYEVVFLPFSHGKAADRYESFLSGFMKAPDDKEVYGRPVGVAQLKDGSLLISEDGNKTVWRVRYGR